MKTLRSILIFPKFKNEQAIQDLRAQFDPLYKHVAPHLTLVFPFESSMDTETLRQHIIQQLQNITPFQLTLNGMTTEPGNYIFLNVTQGLETLIEMHDRLYTGLLKPFYSDLYPYKPHLTVGHLETVGACEQAFETCKMETGVFESWIDAVSVEIIDANEDSLLEMTVPLKAEEYFDLFDAARKPLGLKHRRGDVLAAGTYHQVVEVWTFNTQGEILMTLRDPNKDAYPNYWENTGGSVLAGETSLEAAVRELFEETGIVAEPEELKFVDTVLGKTAFYDIYFLKKDWPLSDIRCQPGETVDAKWVSYSQMQAMIAAEQIAPPIVVRLNSYKALFKCACQSADKATV